MTERGRRHAGRARGPARAGGGRAVPARAGLRGALPPATRSTGRARTATPAPDNPTRRALEAAIGELEGGPALAFASGQAAITALLLSVLRPGDTVALPADGYFTVRAFAEGTLRDLGVQDRAGADRRALPVDFAGRAPGAAGDAGQPRPGRVRPRGRSSAAAHAAGALVAVDNTTATPLGSARWSSAPTWSSPPAPRR